MTPSNKCLSIINFSNCHMGKEVGPVTCYWKMETVRRDEGGKLRKITAVPLCG